MSGYDERGTKAPIVPSGTNNGRSVPSCQPLTALLPARLKR
jgi:hypothetical protein